MIQNLAQKRALRPRTDGNTCPCRPAFADMAHRHFVVRPAGRRMRAPWSKFSF